MERALCVLQDNTKVLTGQQHAHTWTQILVLLVRALAVPLHLINFDKQFKVAFAQLYGDS